MASFLEQYWKLQRDADSKYKNAVVLIEKGSFMECYMVPGLGRADRVAQVLNMIITKCNKNLPTSATNPFMVGFPKAAHDKNVPVMIASGMTIVWVEQVWDNWRKAVSGREITRVITPGTYMEHPPSDEGYYVGCVHTVGSQHYVAVIDTSVGSLETMRLEHDDDMRWFANVYNPREMLCIHGNECVHESFKNVMYNKDIAPYNDPLFQDTFLNKVYTEHVGEDITPAFRTPVVCLLDFIHTCHPKALNNLMYPKEVWSKHMSLHNNAVSQLDLLASERGPGVLGVLNKTRTAMGKRLLARQLLRPMVDHERMNAAYDEIDALLQDEQFRHIQAVLSKIPDLERLMKRVDTKIATEQEIASIHKALRTIADSELLIDAQFVCEWDQVFDCDTNEFANGYDTVLDQLRANLKLAEKNVENNVMKRYGHYAKLEQSKTDLVYQLVTTAKKGEAARKQFGNDIVTSRVNATTTRISGPDIDPLLDTLSRVSTEIQERHKSVFVEWRNTLSVEYGERVRAVSQKVAQLDCACSKADAAVMYKQTRPVVSDVGVASFVDAKELKHPLLENYVGNDCALDSHSNGGILLYGINGAGKSCYSKSIAINLIMAQSGFFVNATLFRFAPFTKIFTRIQCDDNVYKGMSSFTMEMQELRSILRLADEQSLVIGDELCKGTEDLSAVSLVAASIKWMADKHVKFVFATHLHKLPTIDFVKSIPNLRIKHMKSEYNAQLGRLVFLRKLESGQGDPLYGIEIARQILGVPWVANMAMMARQQLVDTKTNVSVKKSRYNKKVLVQECAYCKSNEHLHTHHITPQVSFSKHESKRMNNKDNLIVLCHSCHEGIHHGTLDLQMVHTVDGKLPVFQTI